MVAPKKSASAHDVVPVPHVQVPLPFIYDSRLSPDAKIVFLAVAARCGVHGYTVISLQDLSKELGWSERTVYRHLASLEETGWIDRVRRGAGLTSQKEPTTLAAKYPAVLYRYPYYFLRAKRTPQEIQILRSAVPMDEATHKKMTGWLEERGIEDETAPGTDECGDVGETCQNCQVRPDKNDRSDPSDLTAASCSEVDQDPEGVDQEPEVVVASRQTLPHEPSGERGPDNIPTKEKETPGEDVVSGGLSSDHVGASAPARVTDLKKIADAAAARTREEQTRKLHKSLAKEQKIANLGGKPVPISLKKQLQEIEAVWRVEMERLYPGLHIAVWGAKERGICKALLEKYPRQLVLTAVQYVVREWKELSERFVKGHGVPTMGFLQRFHDTLFVEAQQWESVSAVRDEWEEWFAKNPGRTPPSDLVEKYQRVKGLIKTG